MDATSLIVRSVEEFRAATRGWRAQGLKSAIVPTMGALHEGHLALVREALGRAERVAVSIFVNPKQFGRGEDLSRYPRNEAADSEMLARGGAHLIFAPSSETMYPKDFATTVIVAGPAAAGLEDAFRPQFYDGVATIVTKLLTSAECDFAMFGEKDYQQLLVVSQLVRDLNMPTAIVPVATVREADGLAMSSRNAYLSETQRKTAPLLHMALLEAAKSIKLGKSAGRACNGVRRRLEAAGFRVDYMEARNSATLAPVKSTREPMRVLAAARLGKMRLIDNVPV